MTFSLRSAVLHGAGLTGLLLLGACGKHPPAVVATPNAAASVARAPMARAAVAGPSRAALRPVVAASVAAPAPSALAPLTVAALTLGSAVDAGYRVTHAGTSFAPGDRIIYASVATQGRSSGATLSARWRYLEGTGQLLSSTSQPLATDGPAVTAFSVRNPDLWPAGKYRVEISLDGKPVASQGFEIVQR
jgi:hypothetical protein